MLTVLIHTIVKENFRNFRIMQITLFTYIFIISLIGKRGIVTVKLLSKTISSVVVNNN